MPVTIRIATTAEDRLRVFRFRYAVYVEEMHRAQHYADHDARTIEEPLDATGLVFLAEDDAGHTVGTLRTNFGSETDLGYYVDLYGLRRFGNNFPGRVSITTKLMVAPALRGGTLGCRLAVATYHAALERGVLFDFIDCNPHLEPVFGHLGYRRYMGRIDHPEYGDVLPLVLSLTDLDHLESVRSPLRRICRNHYPHLEANRRLRELVTAFQEDPTIQAA